MRGVLAQNAPATPLIPVPEPQSHATSCNLLIPAPDGPSSLQNALAAPLILMIAVGSGEIAALPAMEFPTPGLVTLGISCVAGLAMNFFSWRLRELLSATSVTVVGVLAAKNAKESSSGRVATLS